MALGNLAGLNPSLGVPIAAFVVMIAAFPISKIAFRLKGGHFAIGTWVIAEVLHLMLANISAVGGGSGTSLIALHGIERVTRESITFWMCLASVVATVGLLYGFLCPRQGLALLAIRDSEVASESQGGGRHSHQALGVRNDAIPERNLGHRQRAVRSSLLSGSSTAVDPQARSGTGWWESRVPCRWWFAVDFGARLRVARCVRPPGAVGG